MHNLPVAAQYLSSALFAWYGFSCFFSPTMIAEFDRYGLPRQRVLTGVLQIAGSVGLLVGHFSHIILLLSAAGLALMMFLALITRIRIRDSFYESTPALSLFLLNLYICIAAMRR